MSAPRFLALRLAILPAILQLAACASVEPNAKAELSLPPERTAEQFAPLSGTPQKTVPGGEVPVEWWKSFGSDKLDRLVSEALVRNADIATAEATLRQSRELAKSVAGATGPQVDAGFVSQRARVSGSLSSPLADPNAYLYSLHTAQLSVSYPLDLFGAGRTKVASARAAAEVAAFRLQAARNTVASNLVLAVIQHASLASQADSIRAAIASNRELVSLAMRRRQLGELGEADVAAANATLAAAEVQLPVLERQIRHEEALVGSLSGIPAGAAVPALPRLEELQVPAELPVSLPADIIARRPDVLAAEAQVRGAAADLGAAIAARLPTIQITGSAGGASSDIASLFASPNLFYAIAGSITQPIFHSGALLHQKRASEAALEAARAQYRSAAMQAFLDVDDALAGLRTDASALDAANRQAEAAGEALELARRQTKLGAIGNFTLLGIAATASQASTQLAQARAARLSDTVALFMACGAPPNNR